MVDRVIINNAGLLKKETEWFVSVLEFRLKQHFSKEPENRSIYDIKPPPLSNSDSTYAKFILKNKLTFEERFVLLLSLIPIIKPQALDVFFKKNEFHQRGFTEFGGIQGNGHGGFIPTIETALFILAGDNLRSRISCSLIFNDDHFFIKEGILDIEQNNKNEPRNSAALVLSKEYTDLFTSGLVQKPDLSPDFAAKLLNTEMTWEDVVLEPYTKEQIMEIKDWIEYGHTLLYDWGLKKKAGPGFRALFYGPSGTGKTLTASVLGKLTNRDVYRIDLSLIISKYIGETEKNLAKILNKAENKDWILFFDEADALFGKRTNISDSHDRYANQEVSYLLQRIEDFDGVIILASNLKGNIDDAFMRRFQSVIHFPLPKLPLRLQLWQKTFSDKCTLEDKIDLTDISKKYELTGGAITNIVRYCSLKAISRKENEIKLRDLEAGIRRELHKEGKTG